MGTGAPMNAAGERSAGWGRIGRLILGLLAGGVFLYAGVLKLIGPPHFASDIMNYQIVPWSVAVRVAFYLPWLEVACGLAIIFRRLFEGALAITGALMVLFIGATIAAKVRGIDISCGCFGSASGNLSFGWHLILDFILLGLLFLLWLWRAPRPAASL